MYLVHKFVLGVVARGLRILVHGEDLVKLLLLVLDHGLELVHVVVEL